VKIEIWSDVVCVWCYIATRRLEKALERFDDASDVSLVWRSFQLDASYPRGYGEPAPSFVAKKMGISTAQVKATADQLASLTAQDGLPYDFDRSIVANTFDAHRLIHLADEHGLAGELHHRLMHAHFAAGESVGDRETLAGLGTAAGLPEAEVSRVLAGEEYTDAVQEDIRQAALLGVTSVPYLLVDRAYRVSGAQPVDVLLTALTTAQRGAREATRA
jgi:predicted DsbA family dithiol-disulfide isomerase